ncbi:hypothetical protein NONO_c50640 [Nocardia nova SH22a]|uniref:Uncharacterized protein n=1 Tax=Nocardia nova SH22a TaxID=1415166 RepID=W5TLN3_9NOCA|nr:hypothetical protein NONO_c50640 [Nocardia nova SH22a]
MPLQEPLPGHERIRCDTPAVGVTRAGGDAKRKGNARPEQLSHRSGDGRAAMIEAPTRADVAK